VTSSARVIRAPDWHRLVQPSCSTAGDDICADDARWRYGAVLVSSLVARLKSASFDMLRAGPSVGSDQALRKAQSRPFLVINLCQLALRLPSDWRRSLMAWNACPEYCGGQADVHEPALALCDASIDVLNVVAELFVVDAGGQDC
jgi:hypothetical protein